MAVGQGLHDFLARYASVFQALHGQRQAALLQAAGALVDGAAADVVAVFGQVGQVAEIGEGADHAHGLVSGELFQQLLQIAVGLFVVVAAKGHRQLANLFDQFESAFAFLLPNHVAQNAAQQPNVFDQGQGLFRERRWRGRAWGEGQGRRVGLRAHGRVLHRVRCCIFGQRSC